MQACITSRFNPIRAGFHGYADVWTRDVLNLGVRPDLLIDKVPRPPKGWLAGVLTAPVLLQVPGAPVGLQQSSFRGLRDLLEHVVWGACRRPGAAAAVLQPC